MDRFGLLPSGIRERYLEEAAIDQELSNADSLRKALKAWDPEIVGVQFVRPDSPEMVMTEKGLTAVRPGRWHVRRRSAEGRPDRMLAIETEDGGYRSPDFGVLNELQRNDMWRQRDAVGNLMRASEDRREKAKKASVDDLKEELAFNIRAAKRVAGESLERKSWGRG